MRLFAIAGMVATAMLSGPVAQAYQPQDMEKVAPPQGGFAFLKGYNSVSGTYKSICLESVSGREAGVDPDGVFNYEYVRSVREAASFRDFDVNSSLAINGIIGGGSVSTEVNYFRENKSRMDNGAAFAYFYDAAAPRYVRSSANFQLNATGREALDKAINTGNYRHFRKECGDYAVVGQQKARRMYGTVFVSESATSSLTQQDVQVKATGRYLLSKLEAAFSDSQGASEETYDESIKIYYVTSGNTQSPSPVNVPTFANAVSQFANEPLGQTLTLSNMYIVPYEKLLDADDFFPNVPDRRRKKVATILNGITTVDAARNFARMKKRRANSGPDKADWRETEERFRRQLVHSRKIFKRNEACLSGSSRACKNLHAQYKNYLRNPNKQQLRNFVNKAKATGAPCKKGYVTTRPDGQQSCKRCILGKQPNYQGNNEGKCLYMPEERPASTVTRLWIDDLKKHTPDPELVLIAYPDVCNRAGRGCGKKAADRICSENGLGESAGHKIWKQTLQTYKPRTQFKNGKWCGSDPGSYNPTKCRTFHYIDCKPAPVVINQLGQN